MVSKWQYLQELYAAPPGEFNSSDVWVIESECFEQGYALRAEKDGDKKTIRFIGFEPPEERLQQLVMRHFGSLFERLVRQQEVRAVERLP
jgi:hypothetical protein